VKSVVSCMNAVPHAVLHSCKQDTSEARPSGARQSRRSEPMPPMQVTTPYAHDVLMGPSWRAELGDPLSRSVGAKPQPWGRAALQEGRRAGVEAVPHGTRGDGEPQGPGRGGQHHARHHSRICKDLLDSSYPSAPHEERTDSDTTSSAPCQSGVIGTLIMA